MESLWQDIRYAGRSLLKSPVSSLTIILSLALAIGANTAVFSILNAILFQPLLYPEPDQLIYIEENQQAINNNTFQDFMNAFSQDSIFQYLAAYRYRAFYVSGGSEPERIPGMIFVGPLFQALGVRPLLGRIFTEQEERSVLNPVCIISYTYWEKRFGRDSEVLGKVIRINGRILTIIGVLPRDFDFSPIVQIWLPMSAIDQGSSKKEIFRIFLVGRLKSGISAKQAALRLNDLSKNQNLSADYKITTETATEYHRYKKNFLINALIMWVSVSTFILLIACANVTSLLLARATAREKETAIRLSLGASRYQILRMFLSESLILSILGGALGFLLAFWLKDLFALWWGENPDMKISVLVFNLVISVLVGIVVGSFPALRNFGSDVKLSLQTKMAAGSDSQTTIARKILVIAEISLAVILVSGAGLMIKSLTLLLSVDPGIKIDGNVTMNLSLAPFKYSDTDRERLFYQTLLERLAEIPGVTAVAATSNLPLDDTYMGREVFTENSGANPSRVYSLRVTPGYFRVMGIKILQGRDIERTDQANSMPVIVVGAKLANKLWPGQNPLGKTVRFQDERLPRIIVGLVTDVRQFGLHAEEEALMYECYAQAPPFKMTFITQSSIPAPVLAPLLRKQVWSIDPDQPVTDVKSMSQVMSASVEDRKLQTWMLTAVGSTGLLISMIGIYGLISYSVASRTKEIGIRVAIGAEWMQIVKMILKEGIFLSVSGLFIGIVGAVALSRFLSSMIYGITPTDPGTFIAVCILFLLAALLASYFPARRAAKIDPVIALRHE